MKLVRWLKKEVVETQVLFRSVPGLILALYILSTVMMNLLASVALINESWIALDAGIIVAFVGFILNDMIVKRFGARAAVKVTILGFVVNLLVAVVFTVVAVIANVSGQYFALGDYATLTQWWIIGASAMAFLVSGILDAGVHHLILKAFKRKPNGFGAHAASALGSTFVGQVVDNMLFGLMFTFPASMIGLWGMTPMTFLALVGFAVAGGIVELVCQALFTPFGFKIAESWRANKVGQEYIDLINKR